MLPVMMIRTKPLKLGLRWYAIEGSRQEQWSWTWELEVLQTTADIFSLCQANIKAASTEIVTQTVAF